MTANFTYEKELAMYQGIVSPNFPRYSARFSNRTFVIVTVTLDRM